MSQFKILTIFYQEYFRSFLKISHQFCVFDLDQSIFYFLFQLVTCEMSDYSAPTVK